METVFSLYPRPEQLEQETLPSAPQRVQRLVRLVLEEEDDEDELLHPEEEDDEEEDEEEEDAAAAASAVWEAVDTVMVTFSERTPASATLNSGL